MDLKDLELKGQKVLVRVDFNVPLDDRGKVIDDTRIRAALPTIKQLTDAGASVILMSHLGRPEKDTNEDGGLKRNKYSLAQVVPTLAKLLGKEVHFIDDTIGDKVQSAVDAMDEGSVLMLENTRFYPEEKKGDEVFAKKLAGLADIYVNDAFGAAHREHASTATVARFFDPERRAYGLLMQQELKQGEKLLKKPARPFCAILGGAKVSDKIGLIRNLIGKIDRLIIGGGMAYTFFKAEGGEVGDSLVEEDQLQAAREILEKAKAAGLEIHLPADSIIADRFSEYSKTGISQSSRIPIGWMGLDIGPDARKEFASVISGARTIFWNGPMGVFEMQPFAQGTYAIAQAVAEATGQGAWSMVGGGDSVSAVNQSGLAERISYISTGGGAMLTLLKGQELPGVKAV